MRLVLDLLDRRQPDAAIVAVVMELAADPERPNAWLLTVGGVRQSYVDLDDPSRLRFEYARFVGMVLDALPEGAVDVLHVGGGGCTLARYVAHTRAGSRQVALEPDGELVALVTGTLGGVPGLDVRVCDGQSGVAGCDSESFDIVLLDAFAVDTIPAELTTAAFLDDVARVLRPGGCFVANLVDAPPLALVRRVAADTARELPHVLMLGDKTVLGGRVSGHVILVACRDPEPVAAVRQHLEHQDDPRLRWVGGPVGG
jgi:SAM-dependent methyltransferase